MRIALLMFLVGCAPSYWVRDSDLRAARAGNLDAVPAAREPDADPQRLSVRLSGSSLRESESEQSRDQMVLVTPRHTRLKAGWIVLGVGALLTAAGIAGGLSALAPCTATLSTDESCWVPQMVAGSTLGSIGGVTMLIGGIIAGTSLHDAELR
jgi:hypothetical protein